MWRSVGGTSTNHEPALLCFLVKVHYVRGHQFRDTLYIAPIYLYVPFLCRLSCLTLTFSSVAIINECTVEDTFSFEKPVQTPRKAHLDKNTYRSYLNTDKIYLYSTLFWNQFSCCLLVKLLGCGIHKYSPSMTDVKDIEQICILVLS